MTPPRPPATGHATSRGNADGTAIRYRSPARDAPIDVLIRRQDLRERDAGRTGRSPEPTASSPRPAVPAPSAAAVDDGELIDLVRVDVNGRVHLRAIAADTVCRTWRPSVQGTALVLAPSGNGLALRLDERGRMQLPLPIRRILEWDAGTPLAIWSRGTDIVLSDTTQARRFLD